MSANFDTLTNVLTDLDGEISDVEALDADLDPNHVLPRKEKWAVRVQWQVSGLCAPGLGGDWQVRVNLESLGKGFEGTILEMAVPVATVAPDRIRKYDQTIILPAPNSITDFEAGTYKLIIIITHTNTGGGVTKRTRMAGFYEGHLLEFTDSEV